MEWTVVKIEETSGKNVPFASIGRGQLEFNAVACSMIDDSGQYKYARLLTGIENGRTIVAVKFLCEPGHDTLPIKRKFQNGKVVKGMSIVNKGVIEKLFGKDGSNPGMERHKVERIGDDMLKIID